MKNPNLKANKPKTTLPYDPPTIHGFYRRPTEKENLLEYHAVLAARRLTVLLVICLALEIAVLVWWITGH